MHLIPSTRLVLAALAFTVRIWAVGAVVQAPSYTAAGIVNAASYSADALAPNVIASIYGVNLSFNTATADGLDPRDGGLPVSLSGVTVYVSGIAAGLFFVSPQQINFLIPNAFLPGSVGISVIRDGVAGAVVPVTLHLTGPGLFQDAGYNAIATHLDGSLITSDSPGQPAEWVVLYAAGLGRTIPDALNYAPPAAAAVIQNMATFSVLIDGAAADPAAVNYAGLAPGFAGLYQVNLQLPGTVGSNPEIRLSIGGAVSVPKIHLWVHGT